VLSYLERIGGVLVAPRAALERALSAPEGQGFRDVLVLMLLRILCGDTPRLARAVSLGLDHGLFVGFSAVLSSAQGTLPDLFGILLAALVMSLFVGRGARPHGHSLDLAAYVWVPYFAAELSAALVASVRGRPPSPRLEAWVQGVALAWSVAVWVMALVAARSVTGPRGAHAP
jgi:hypothetical protein